MALYNKLSDKRFQNYIKEDLVLQFAKEGLEDFVLDVVTDQQNDILQDIYKKKGVARGDICTSCTTYTVIPCPTTGICKINRGPCRFHGQNVPTQSTQCRKNICYSFRDLIRRDHEFGGPSWKNTDASKWCVDPYSIAKCYMPPDGYSHVKTLQETDFNGIIAVMINNRCFDTNKISSQAKTNLQQARDIGKSHRHTSDYFIQDSALTANIDTLIDLLNDPVCLKSNSKAQGAVQILQQIKSDVWTITPKDVTRVLEKAIERKMKDGKEEIEKYTESKIENAKEEISKFTDDKTKDATEEITEHAKSKKKEALLDIERHAESKTKGTKEDIDEYAKTKNEILTKEIDEHTNSKTNEAKENLDKYTEHKTNDVELEIDGHFERKTKEAKEKIDHQADSKRKETIEAIDKYAESRTKETELKIDGHAESTIDHAKEDLEQHASSKVRDMKEELNKHADKKTKEVKLQIDGHAENKTKHAKEEISEHAELMIKNINKKIYRCAERKTNDAMEVIIEQTQNTKEEIDQEKQSVISELQRMKMLISEMSTHEFSEIFHRRTEAPELQRHLLELYMQSPYYLKTEVSPFMPEEEDYLDDLFVHPLITRKIKTISNEEKAVRTYDDFFTNGNTRFKNIVLCADPGMGKTTICKRIISLWCEAQQYNNGQSAVREYKNKHRDVETMKKIKFLFYVSLPHSPPDVHTIEEMIRRQLLDTGHYQTLRNVLENEPENCLVILDGLDEWTTPNITPTSPRVPSGLPDREVKSQYTTIFATRPFKLEKLGPFSSDVEIKLHALDKQGIKEHIQSILAKLDKDGNRSSIEVYNEITKRNIDKLLYVPLILKMIICLWFDDKTIHESITGIYMCITETLLDRASQKSVRSDTKQSKSPGVMLPECFKEQTKCKEMADILIQLSEFAFNLLFKQGKKGVFNMKSSDSQFAGLTQCLKIGLLSKAPLRGMSSKDRYTSVSFIHETFQEFFSALFISVYENDENMKLLLKTCDTLASFLGLNRFFMFVTEMNPPLLEKVCEHVADIVDHDARVHGFRNMESPTFLWPYNDGCTCLLEQVQVGITNCIEQTISIKQFYLNIRDIFIDTSKDIYAPVQNIVPDSVTSMHICHTKEIPKKTVDFLHTCEKVRCIWYYKPSFLVKWQDLFPGVNLFERYTCLETLHLRNCKIGHTSVSAILLHQNIKNVYLNDIHSFKDDMCPCSAIHGRQAEPRRKDVTKINTLCIVQSSEVLHHVEAAPNLQTLVWDHTKPCFSNAETISNLLRTSCNLRTVRIKELKQMELSADKNAIINRICEGLSRLQLEACEITDCNLSRYQESKVNPV